MSNLDLPLSRLRAQTALLNLQTLRRWLPSLIVVLLAIVARQGQVLTADDSWLLTLGEKWLAGAVPYVDFIEVNPPASILLYMPAVLAGHWLGVRPETCVTVMMFAGVLISLGLTGEILRRSGLLDKATAPWWAAAILFLDLVLPGDIFAQREHIAAVLVLPVLATYLAALARKPAPLRFQVVAGLAGGVCVAIKPYFGIALALPLIYVLSASQGGLWPRLRLLLSPVNVVIAALAAAYAVSVGLFFPAFIRDMLPLVAAIYLPVRISLLVVLAWAIKCCVPPVFLLRIAEPSRRPDPMPLLLLLASAGFAIALVIQGKVWPYHVFPTLTLALLALIGGLVEAGLAGRVPLLAPRMLAAIIGGGIILGYAAYLFSVHTHPALLIEEVRKLALTRPKILAVTSDISLGHPLTREVDGQWVDRYAAHWITMNADLILNDGRTLTPAGRAKVEAYVAADKAALIADIEQHQPDIILVEESWWKPWSDRTPDVSAALLAYRPIKTIEDTIIMRRREP